MEGSDIGLRARDLPFHVGALGLRGIEPGRDVGGLCTCDIETLLVGFGRECRCALREHRERDLAGEQRRATAAACESE